MKLKIWYWAWLLMVLGGAAELKAVEENPPPPGVEQVVSSNVKFLALGGLSIVDAWYTINSFVVGPRYGYQPNVGLAVEIEFSNRFSLSVGANYETRTIGVNQDGTLVYLSRNTLLFPVLGKLSVLPLLSILGGPYVASAISNWSYEPANPPRPVNTTKIDVGFILGVELRYPISFSRKHLLAVVGQLQYLQGLTNIASSPLEDFRYREFHFLGGVSLAL